MWLVDTELDSTDDHFSAILSIMTEASMSAWELKGGIHNPVRGNQGRFKRYLLKQAWEDEQELAKQRIGERHTKQH